MYICIYVTEKKKKKRKPLFPQKKKQNQKDASTNSLG